MVSTYTLNQGIEKPGTGDQSGTWGGTVNTNMDIIDRAASGVGALTLTGSTTTLTTTDGTLSDGMYRVLVLGDSGDVGSDNTITISPNDADKLYLVYNNLTANRGAIFTQGSGDNATVENGETAWIYADGAGSGAAVRVATSSTKLLDQDGDTGIRVEEGGDDDDTIRFDVAGAEDFTITANTFTAVSGSTIAAQALTATTIGSSAGITITGTTPTLTIGDAGDEDSKIVFDGAAQDYYIGLDDTDDDLKIGLGSAVGTTDHMVFDAAGTVTLPLQPAFLAYVGNSTVNNVTGAGTDYTIIWNIEVFDQNADYNASNGIFTAPVTGRYHFDVQIKLGNYSASITRYAGSFIASNRTGQIITQKGVAPETLTGSTLYATGFSFLIDMDASDTCYISIVCAGLAGDTVDIAGNSQPDTMFSGHLVG